MNSTWKVKAYLAVGFGLALGTLGCGGGGGATSTVRTLATLTPKSGVVLTGQTQQMTFTPGSGGSSNVTWSVNGVTGGDATVGTIDANGLYTAPVVPPSPNYAMIRAASTTESATAVLTIVSPGPTVSMMTPAAVTAGNGDTVVTVSGAGFTPQSVIEADTGTLGRTLATTFVSDSELTATIPASMLASMGVIGVGVSTPSPGGGMSSLLTFTTLSAGTVTATNNPQVASYAITSPRDANVTIEFGPDTTYGLKTWARPTATGGGPVSIYVAGMRAFTTYHMRAMVDFPDGTEFLDADHTFTTGGLPSARLPQVTIPTPGVGTRNPGVEILSLFGVTPPPLTAAQNPVHAVVYDLDGNLIWYYDYDPDGVYGGGVTPVKLLPDGNVVFIILPGNRNELDEVDLGGNSVQFMTIDNLNARLAAAGFSLTVDSIHHEVTALPNGNLVILTEHNETFTDFMGISGTSTVAGDAIIELDKNWNPVWVWDTFDHLDVTRQVLGTPVGSPPNWDWTHGNALTYSPDDGNLLFSMRNQSWVIKIDFENGNGNGNVLWRFGYQGDFTLDAGAPAAWQYGQHYPSFVSLNTSGTFKFGVFDDGNNRVLDDAGDICGTTGQIACYSRVPIYDVDENAKTVHVQWEDKTAPGFSGFLGSMQVLNNTDVEFASGALTFAPPTGEVMEVTQQTPPVPVWELDVTGQFVYRGLRIPSLYPGIQW
jgi:arylsulfate sulfotransferase